jgi:hypothetical protein
MRQLSIPGYTPNVAELTLAWWQARLNALYITFTSGTLEVQFEGRVSKFRSNTELKEAIELAESKIAELSGIVPDLPRSVRVDMSDG